MAQVVEALPGQSCVGEVPVEGMLQAAGVDGVPGRGCEYQSPFVPGGCRESLLGLPPSMCSERVDERDRQGPERSNAPRCLGFRQHEFSAHSHQCPADVDVALVDVDILPAEAESFTLANDKRQG